MKTSRWLALPVALVVLFSFVSCDGYPNDWPGVAHSWWTSRGGCPDLEGDYDGIDYDFLVYFGVGSPSDRWRDHHARVTQARDGEWLKLDIAPSSKGMRGLLGELGSRQTRFRGLGFPVTLHRGGQFRCSGGWLYSLARDETGGDGFAYVEMRFAKDRKGGLVAKLVTRHAQSIGWADSPSIPLGHSNTTGWMHWPARDPADDLAVAALEGMRLRRASWINHGSSVPTYVTNFHQTPVCARIVREFRVAGQKPIVSALGNRPSRGATLRCPDDAGEIGPIDTAIAQLDIPGASAAFGDYRLEWQRLDRLAEPWRVEPIADVRELPMTKN